MEAKFNIHYERNVRQYYAITTSMTFEKTVLVPVNEVKDLDEAIDLVDAAVNTCDISLLTEEAYCETKKSRVLADEDGTCEIDDEIVKKCKMQVITKCYE